MGNQYDYRQLRQIINANHDRFSELNFDNSFSTLQKVESLAEWFKIILKEYNDWIEYLDNFVDKFDENLYVTIDKVLTQWRKDGLFDELIKNGVFPEFVNTLNTKADKLWVDNELSKKANQKDVDEKFQNVLDGSIAGFYNTLNDLQTALPNGAKGVYVTKDTLNMYYYGGGQWNLLGNYNGSKVMANSIILAQRKGLKIGKNLFNKYSTTRGYLNLQNGTIIDNASINTSAYRIIEGTIKRLVFSSATNGVINVCFYSDVDVFVSGVQIEATNANRYVDIPATAKLFRFSYPANQTESMQVEYGSTATAYEDFIHYDPDEVLPNQYDPMVKKTSQISDDIVTLNKLSGMKKSKNLFNPASAKIGYYVGRADGALIADQNYYAVEDVEILPSTKYTISPSITSLVINYVFKDKNKTVIAGADGQITVGGSQTITSPANGAYISYSMPLNTFNTHQFEKSATATTYEKYYNYNPNYVEPSSGTETNGSAFKPIVLKVLSATDFQIMLPVEIVENGYMVYPFQRSTRPYTGGEDENCDLWRIYGLNYVETDDNLNNISNELICNQGAFECAISAYDYNGFIGTYHGYEFFNTMNVYVDGVLINHTTAKTIKGKKVKIVYKSKLVRHGTERDYVADVVRVYNFEDEKLNLYQKYNWTGAYTKLKTPYMTMLPILRKSGTKQITDTAFYDKDWIEYNVAESGELNPINIATDNVKQANIYGKTSKYSAETFVKYKNESKKNTFFLTNAEAYNKFYYAYNVDLPVAIGDVWEIDTMIHVTKAN